MKTLSLITMGCSKNTVDSEYLLNLLARAGFAFTGSVEDSDAVIINTCGFIGAAATESRDMISSVISRTVRIISAGEYDLFGEFA